MTLTRKLNDPAATEITGPARHEALDMASSDGTVKRIRDNRGIVVEAFRGTTDPRITGWASYNTNGVKCYTYPNAAGNGLVTTTVHP